MIAETRTTVTRTTATRTERAAHLLLAAYLVSLLAVPKLPTSIAALTCIVALAAAHGSLRAEARAAWRHMAILVVPAAVYLLLLLAQIVAGMAAFKMSSQVLVGTLALAVGLSAVPGRPADVRRLLLPAAAVGAIGSAVLAVWQVWGLGYERPYGWLGGNAMGNGAIKFGDLSVVQALLSFVLVVTGLERWRRLLGLAGLFSGVFALALAQTRGGIIGFLLAVAMLAIALALRHRRMRSAGRAGHAGRGGLRRGTTVAMVAVMLVLTLSAAGVMQDRFAQIEPQVERYLQGDIEGSQVGQRLALWHTAIRAGLDHPVVGVGFGHFGDAVDRQRAAGDIPDSFKIEYRQVHSEYLTAFAEAGVIGFVALLLMFVAPAVALFRRIAGGDASPAVCAALVTAAAFAGFALTDDMFDRQITVIAFFLLNAWLLRAAWEARAGTGAGTAP